MKLKRLREQVVVITGATSGIGLATAREAARQGARLVLAARSEPRLAELAAELARAGCAAIPVVADVGDEKQVRRIALAALQRFGGFDTWVNNAGVSLFGRLEEANREDQRHLFDTNFWGVVHGSLVAVEHLRARGGALINVGSEISDLPLPLQGMYAASKHAVKAFTDTLRIELAQERIPVSVTLVKPASIETGLVAHAKNYLAREPTLAPPVYAPEIAARAILHAAQHPRRELFVGGAARLVSALGRFAPRLAEATLGRAAFRLQQTRLPSRGRHEHALYRPGSPAAERLGEHRPTGRRVWRWSPYTSAALHPGRTAVVVLASALVIGALWRAAQRA